MLSMESFTEKLGAKALEYLNGLEALTAKYAPDVVDAALTVVQINGAQRLLTGALCAILALITVWAFFKWLMPRLMNSDADPVWIFFGVLTTGAFIVAGVKAAHNLLDIWNWVAVIEPKLYIAYKIFEKAL
jgi:hypothetical protein